MRACLVLCVAAALVGAVRPECGACIQGACYRRHDLPGFKDYDLGEIDRNKNILYFRHYYRRKVIWQCALDTLLCNTTTYEGHMADYGNIWQLLVDQRNGDTYGIINENSNKKLYKLDLLNTRKDLLVPRKVYYISFGDKIYYSTYGHGIYTFKDGESRLVAGTKEFEVYNFIVDKNNDIYFKSSVDSGDILMWLSKGVVDRTVYWGADYSMSLDRDGNAVFIHVDSGAVYRATDGQLVEVGVINDLLSYKYYWHETPLFDKDNNLVYRNYSEKYFHLKRDADVNCTYSISQNRAIITETVVSTTPYTIETTTQNQ